MKPNIIPDEKVPGRCITNFLVDLGGFFLRAN